MLQALGADFDHVEPRLFPGVGLQIVLRRVAQMAAFFPVHCQQSLPFGAIGPRLDFHENQRVFVPRDQVNFPVRCAEALFKDAPLFAALRTAGVDR